MSSPPAITGDMAALATGQAFEFRVWSELIQQSRGQLHVFLPLLDVGLDAVLHRLADGAYIPLQLKGRTRPVRGELEFVVAGAGLVDDAALMIVGWLEPSGLGPYLLVVSEAEFKELASFDARLRLWSAAVPVRPPSESYSRWAPHMVAREALAARLLAPAALPPEAPAVEFVERAPERLGFLGEQEVIRQLAMDHSLDLFRPFPDLEVVEVLVRSNQTRAYAGLQVKTGTWEASNPQVHIRIRTHFTPAASTHVAVLCWRPELARFDERCLLIPSEKIPAISDRNGEFWELEFRPETTRRTRLDPYRVELASLAVAVRSILLSDAPPPASIGPAMSEPSPSGGAASPEQIAAAASDLEAIHTVEACTRSHHVVAIGYVNEKGSEDTLAVCPAFIKTSTRGHVVLWAKDRRAGHWLELRLDGIRSARDTGEEFTPDW